MQIKLTLLAKASKYSLDPLVFEAMIRWESGFNASVINTEHTKVKANHSIGLGEVKLATARLLGYKGTYDQLRDPDTNLEYAAMYLAKQFERYGNYRQALSAYNAGTATMNNKFYVDRALNYKEELNDCYNGEPKQK